jgi:hypothetical protein
VCGVLRVVLKKIIPSVLYHSMVHRAFIGIHCDLNVVCRLTHLKMVGMLGEELVRFLSKQSPSSFRSLTRNIINFQTMLPLNDFP